MKITTLKIVNHDPVTIIASNGDKVTSNDPAAILQYLSLFSGSTNAVWDIDAFFAPVFRLLGPELCQKLARDRKAFLRPHSMFYIPEKVFTTRMIPYNKAAFYSLNRYFPDETAEPIDISHYARRLAAALKIMALDHTRKLTSPIAIYEDQMMSGMALPKWDVPEDPARYAWLCSGRLWIEAYQLGYWDRAFDYDIKGAFPTFAAGLVTTNNCEWLRSNKYIPEAVYGYCHATVNIKHWATLHPIIYVDPCDNVSYTPVGTFDTYITKSEIDFIQRWQLGTVEILDGYWAIQGSIEFPLRGPIRQLMKHKQHDNEDVRALAKAISVGLYGKFGEMQGKAFGPYFNPVFFAEISTRARLAVAEYIYQKRLVDHVLHVSVDGFLADRLTMPVNRNGMIPNWEMKGPIEALVASSGWIFSGGKRPQGLTIADVLEAARAHPGRSFYDWHIDRPVKLGQAVETGRVEDTGEILPHCITLDFNRMPHDREFKATPRTGRDILTRHFESAPIRY